TGSRALSTARPGLFLLLAIPVSLFLYLKEAPEAASFLAGYSSALLNGSLLWPFIFAAFFIGAITVFHLPVRGRKWLAASVVGLPAFILLLPCAEKHRLIAFGICLPGWFGMAVWLPAAWREARKP